MDDAEFERLIRDIDLRFSNDGVPALQRPILAYFQTTGRPVYGGMKRQLGIEKYEGENLYFAIQEWYERHYPKHATLQRDWGKRWMRLRGEFFQVRIPIIFNPTGMLDPFKFMNGVTISFLRLLSPLEQKNLIHEYNLFFRQASDINLCLLRLRAGKQSALVQDFLATGLSDLIHVGESFTVQFPTSVLFQIQQSAEKFLKALLLVTGLALTEAEVKSKFGHNVPKLVAACVPKCPELQSMLPDAQLLGFDVSVRYRPNGMNATEVIQRMDYAFRLCHTIALTMLKTC